VFFSFLDIAFFFFFFWGGGVQFLYRLGFLLNTYEFVCAVVTISLLDVFFIIFFSHFHCLYGCLFSHACKCCLDCMTPSDCPCCLVLLCMISNHLVCLFLVYKAYLIWHIVYFLEA